MPDMERVEKALNICNSVEHPCNECPYLTVRNCSLQMVSDVRALMKEQQEQIDKLLEESASNAEMAEGMKELLKEQPQIVRCKDCKYWSESYSVWFCPYHFNAHEDWFCADGERRTDDAETIENSDRW